MSYSDPTGHSHEYIYKLSGYCHSIVFPRITSNRAVNTATTLCAGDPIFGFCSVDDCFNVEFASAAFSSLPVVYHQVNKEKLLGQHFISLL